jgi:Caspase domain
MTRLPDPAAAYALLIGVGEFEDAAHYAPLPSAHASVGKLAALLRDRDSRHAMWQLPDDRIEVLGPAVTADQARKALQHAVSRPGLAALLVCVSGHGHRYSDDGSHPPGLHLAMTNSSCDLPGSHWHFEELRSSLARAAATVRHIVLIVDACWADGASVEPGQAGRDSAQVDRTEVPGVVVLTATRYRVAAWPRWRETGWTAFLGALIESIEAGISGSLETLTTVDVFDQARSRLAAAHAGDRRVPAPSISRYDLSDVPLCRNERYIEPAAVADPDQGEITDFRDVAACFAAIEARHRHDDDGLIPRIVEHFCGGRDVTEDDVAQLVRMLGESKFSGYQQYGYDAACARRPASAIAALAHSLHGGGGRVDDQLLSGALRRHAGPVVLGVYEAMARRGCPDCAEAAEALSARVLADAALSPAALAVWR